MANAGICLRRAFRLVKSVSGLLRFYPRWWYGCRKRCPMWFSTGATAMPWYCALPDIRRPWARWRTKQPDYLESAFAVPKGSWNLAQLERLTAGFDLDTDHRDVDVVRWRFTREEELVGSTAQELFRALAESFRRQFGASPSAKIDK
jgi:hypothetical protein